MRVLLRVLIATLLVGGLGAEGASAAPTWTRVASGTTSDISAMTYLADGTLLYATVDGQVLRSAPGGTPEVRVSAPGVVFDDIAARGDIALAVGAAGAVYRSTDGGRTWTTPTIPTSNDEACVGVAPLGDVHQVAFASREVVFLFGARNQVLRSSDGGGSWRNNNRRSGGGCNIELPDDVTGAFLLPDVTPAVGYLQTRHFGHLAAATDDLTTARRVDSGLNGFEGVHRLAGDPARPSRQWGVAAATEPDGRTFFSRTTDAWATSTGWTIDAVGGRTLVPANDVAYATGTVLAAGPGGELLTSRDGVTFVLHDAGGTLATQPWRAVALADGTRGAVAGADGALAVTATATAPADGRAPTGRIDGPASAVVGDTATFAARVADEAGGSGVDPASLRWSVVGRPAQTGPTARYALTAPGVVRVTLAFRDRAGNAATAVRDVVVGPRPEQPPVTTTTGATTPTTPTTPVAPTPTPPAPAPVTVVSTVAAPPSAPTAPTTKTARRRGTGGTLALTVPTACTASGSSVRVAVGLERAPRGARLRSVRFTLQGAGTDLVDRRAPFSARVPVRGRRGATRRLTVRASVRLRGGRTRVRTVSASLRLCP